MNDDQIRNQAKKERIIITIEMIRDQIGTLENEWKMKKERLKEYLDQLRQIEEEEYWQVKKFGLPEIEEEQACAE